MLAMGSTKRTAAISRKVKYSKMETRVLDLLSKGSSVTSEELVKKLYVVGEAPYYARESVTSLLRALIKKLAHNGEPFTITKTQPGGPYPTSYRKQKR